jgi:hypothetical protein
MFQFRIQPASGEVADIRERNFPSRVSPQNSEQFITTRPRQISLRQMILHFSWTATAPQTGQITSALGDVEFSGCAARRETLEEF